MISGAELKVFWHWLDGSNPNYRNNPIKLVFYVPDAKAMIAAIRADGLEITREAEPLADFGNMVIGLGLDPDGYVVEFIQTPT